MAKIVYFSLTGQTQKFVQKLPQYESYQIDAINPFVEMDGPFILVVPTYEREVLEIVDEFMQTGSNQSLCQGIFGGGNRNFAQLFCFTAKDIAEDYQLPLLHLFEFQGSASDVQALDKEMKSIYETANS